MAFPTSGIDASVNVDGNTIAKLNNWNLALTQATSETTAFGDYDDTFVYTTRNATVTADGYFSVDDTAQGNIIDLFMKETTPSATVVLDLFNSGAYKFYASALVTGCTVGTPLKDTQSVSFTFQVTGGVSRAES